MSAREVALINTTRITNARCILFDAYGLAMQALRSGMTVYYASLSYLIADLKKAAQQGKLERRWRVYTRPDVLIIDEAGYMQLDRASAELLFRVICSRYENGSITDISQDENTIQINMNV